MVPPAEFDGQGSVEWNAILTRIVHCPTGFGNTAGRRHGRPGVSSGETIRSDNEINHQPSD
jgi:hypothetical protein